MREKTHVYCRSYKNYNRNLFQENLRNLDWSIFDLLDISEDMWSMIYKAILFEVNHMCPYKKTKISVNRPEWMNRELLEYEIHRDTLFRIYNRSKTLYNEYFINIGKELASKLPDSHFDYNINGVCNLQLSVFNEFTNEILFKILKETSLSKSSGLDEISTRLLVDAFYAIPDILVKFFNFSLKNGQIPQCFKIAKVTPLPKKGQHYFTK